MKRILSLFSMLAVAAAALAQPANDDCAGIVNLGTVPFCDPTVFNNVGATASMVGNDNLPVSPSCMGIGQPQHDVWFQFTASDTITDYRITVTGVNATKLVNPLVVIYRGDCQFDGLSESGCAAPAPSATETILDIVGLTPGLDYFLRISDYGGAAQAGDFTLCIQEIPPVTDITQGSSTLCKGKITDSGGLDENYGPDEDFTFKICPTDNPSCIKFTLDWYNIEHGAASFTSDVLQFFDGPDVNSPLITEISGFPDFLPGDEFVTGGGGVSFVIQATSGCLTLHFTSDEAAELDGFSGSWECSQGGCLYDNAIEVDPDITNAQIEAFVAEAATQVTITNIDCPYGAYGTFLAGDDTDLGLAKGLIMTSGSVDNAVGPNDSGSTTQANGSGGDADLDVLSQQQGNGSASNDACILELDVFVKTDQLTFEYIFGSEEYSEFVNTTFNDIFAFLVSGPGLQGDPALNGQKNIAIVPGSGDPAQINSINYLTNWEYFHNNEQGQSLEYDGLTSDKLGIKKSITARQDVTPCQTYHLKFAIADRGDQAYDSGVFISEIKGGTPTVSLAFLNGVDYLSEYCFGQPDNLIIRLDNPKDVATTYNVVIGGTAEFGVDYTTTLPNAITFQPGVSELTFPIGAILDAFVEPVETITISLTKDFGCGTVTLVTATIDVADQLIVDVTAGDTALVCAGGTLQLEATGATSYFWTPPGAVSNPNIANPTVTPTQDIWLSVLGTGGTCFDKDSVFVHIINPQIDVQALATTNICLGTSVPLEVTDNVDHAGLKWTPGAGLDDATSPTPIATPTETTTYVATVEIAGCKVSDQVTIEVDTLFFPELTTLDTFICQNYSVDLGEDIDPSTTNYSWSPALGLSDNNVSGPLATPQSTTTYVLTATSANGHCTETASVNITVAPADVDINGDAYREICLGDSIQLFANTSGTGTIEWESTLGQVSVQNPIWAKPDESAWYKVSFGINQCIVFDSVYVRVDSLPNQMMTLDPLQEVYCPGEQVLIKSPTYEPGNFPGLQPDQGNIFWYPDNMLLTPDSLWNLLFTTTDTITYYRVIKNYGCIDTASITVNVFQPVVITATVSDSYTCPNDLVQLGAVFVGNYNVEWEGDVSNKNIINPTAAPYATTTYTVKMKDVPCPSSASVTVTVEPPPTILINKDPIVCIGNSIELQHNDDPAISFLWTLPDGTSSSIKKLFFDPAVAGTYTVTATGVNSCTSTATTTVTVAEASVDLGPDLQACRELVSVSLNPQVTGWGGGTFNWNDGGTGSPYLVNLDTDGKTRTMYVTYVYANNCEAYDSIKIKTLPGVDIVPFTFSPDSLEYCRGAKVVVTQNATSLASPLTYAWSLNGQPDAAQTTKTGTFFLSGEGENTVSVTVTTPDGCSAKLDKPLSTRECFGIPNAFTPDGDGTNDNFEIWYEPGAITIESLKIYARWGEVVYDYDGSGIPKWDGRINGKEAPMDVYIYKVNLRRPDETREIISGDVTLIR